jgi:hypothetical protein
MKNLILFLSILLSSFQIQNETCEKFLNQEIKPLEFKKAQVVRKYTKDGFGYIDLKLASSKVVAFTLKNYDKSNLISKIKVNNYVNKMKNELIINRIVVYDEGANADVFKHNLICE